jgi:hypothetical protein
VLVLTRITKILILSLTALLTLTLLAGCDNSEKNNHPTSDDIDLASTYSLNTDKITVWSFTFDSSLPEDEGGEGGYTIAFEITDPADIQKMIESVDFTSWEKTEVVYEGVISFYIQFADTATIATYGDAPYGYIGQGAPAKNGKLPDNGKESGYYFMPESILTTLNEMIEKYRPDLITEE